MVRLATAPDGTPDGRLNLVSRDGQRCVAAKGVATMQQALENWSDVAESLAAQYATLCGDPNAGEAVPDAWHAPIPRAWQWLDGSAYASHGKLMDAVIGAEPVSRERPLMYQGVSDRFYGATDDVPFPSESLGIDFEGEFGVLVDRVPMGTTPEDALQYVRLIVQINDWSLRALAGPEMQTGFGWIQAKPPCSMAPFALTPDELGSAWKNGRVCLPLTVEWNGAHFGAAEGEPMEYGFHELIAHAARTRELVSGTVIGSGTVSNENFREIGSSCIAERRGIEIVDNGEAKTQYMSYGDSVRMEARTREGELLFGEIHQRVVQA